MTAAVPITTPLDHKAASLGAAMVELAIGLCGSNAEITQCLSINRRLINEIGQTHPAVWNRIKAATTKKRQAVPT